MSSQPVSVFWFRRDLRLSDNAGLYHALKAGRPVLCLFIFDTDILSKLTDAADRRVTFIHQTLQELDKELQQHGSALLVQHGQPLAVWQELTLKYTVAAVYTNHDYEPYAQQRDQQVAALLQSRQITLHTFKDQVIFEKAEVTRDDGKPYTVFTPYKKKWLQKLKPFYVQAYPTEKYRHNLLPVKPFTIPSLGELGFQAAAGLFPAKNLPHAIIRQYHATRDFPALAGTSRLSVHLRFGTISIREVARAALELNATWLNELIWRDFYHMILYQFPHVIEGAFKPAYDRINWLNPEDLFRKWCDGQTGYPLVDAGMRELNQTGFMHNRVRMLTASFLTKHLLVDWRWGEAYFAQKLLDYDLAANNGGWQWAAGSGCDAAPYFRVFSPLAQTNKFDPQEIYIKKWVPEYKTAAYPKPIVVHEEARLKALAQYKAALKKEAA